VLDFFKQLDKRVDNLPDQISPELNRIAALAVERILWGASTEKAKRFAAVFASQISSPDNKQALEDAAYFIRALDELSDEEANTHTFSSRTRTIARSTSTRRSRLG
jgi:TPP-dependent 2-oxoacid decarboxylase